MEKADVPDVAGYGGGTVAGALSTIDLIRRGVSVPVPLSEVSLAGLAQDPA